MQPGIIARGFIASPSDVQEERDRALNVFTRWNAVNSLDRALIVEAVRVETQGESQLGRHPQEIINSTLLKHCDFLVAIFWATLGTPTSQALSGTLHEIAAFADRKGGEWVKLFFSKKPLPQNHDTQAWKLLEKWKVENRSKLLYIEYDGIEEFDRRLRDQLDIIMNKLEMSEDRAELWGRYAVLTELGQLEVDKKRHAFEMQKRNDEKLVQIGESVARR